MSWAIVSRLPVGVLPMSEVVAKGREEAREFARPGQGGIVALYREVVGKVQVWGLVLLTFASFFPRLFHYEEYLFFVLFALTVGATWLDGRTVWVRTPLDLPFFLLVGWILVTIPFATDPAYSFAEWRKLITQMLVFYWTLLVARLHSDGAIRRQVLAAVVIGTVVLSLYALVDFVQRNGSLMNRTVRAWAPSSDSNWLTTYLVIGIPLVISAGVAIKANWRRLAYFGAVLGPALLTQVFSYMRAGWLALVFQGIALALFTGRRRLILWVLGCCLAGVFSLLALSQVGYQKDTVHPLSLNIRLGVWKLALEEVVAHPLVGIGYGNDTFVKRFKDHVETGPNPELHISKYGPHNTFLMLAMGSGIPALVFILWMLVSAVRTLLHRAGRVPDERTYVFLIGIAVMIVGFATRNCFDYMFAGSLAYLFWILVATGLAEATAKVEVKAKV